MSDSRSATAFDEECERYAQALSKLKDNDSDKVLEALREVRKHLDWLRTQDLRLTKFEHRAIDISWDNVNRILQGNLK